MYKSNNSHQTRLLSLWCFFGTFIHFSAIFLWYRCIHNIFLAYLLIILSVVFPMLSIDLFLSRYSILSSFFISPLYLFLSQFLCMYLITILFSLFHIPCSFLLSAHLPSPFPLSCIPCLHFLKSCSSSNSMIAVVGDLVIFLFFVSIFCRGAI